MKKTKIVCTIGPKTESVEMLTKLANAGMNVMRLNFSHGDFEEHGQRITNLREVMANTGAIAPNLVAHCDKRAFLEWLSFLSLQEWYPHVVPRAARPIRRRTQTRRTPTL